MIRLRNSCVPWGLTANNTTRCIILLSSELFFKNSSTLNKKMFEHDLKDVGWERLRTFLENVLQDGAWRDSGKRKAYLFAVDELQTSSREQNVCLTHVYIALHESTLDFHFSIRQMLTSWKVSIWANMPTKARGYKKYFELNFIASEARKSFLLFASADL